MIDSKYNKANMALLSTKCNLGKLVKMCIIVAGVFTTNCLPIGLMQGNLLMASEIQQACQRHFKYSIYLSGIHTGEMSRDELWQGKKAVITSKSEVSILGIGSLYHQLTELSWSVIRNEWLTNNFHQQVTGFRSRDMKVTLNNDDLESRVDLDGKVMNYHSKMMPLRDIDTIAIQIRENILNGIKQFSLLRQASDGVEPYQFHIKDKLTSTLVPWGELQLIPVEQTGADEVTYFFAPSMNYQLVKALYHGMILQGVIELDSYVSSCDTMTNSH